MKSGDVIRIMMVSGGSRCFTLNKIYGAKVTIPYGDGNHRMEVVDDNGELVNLHMFRTIHLSGGSFKQVILKGVKCDSTNRK